MKIYFSLLFLIIIAIKTNGQSDVATAKWMQQPPAIDGKLTEWKQPLSFYDANTKLLFDIAADSSNIYLCFENEDEMNQMKMMRAGMKITLSTKGKPKREATITYPSTQKQDSKNTPEELPDNVGNENATNKSIQVHDLASFRNNFLQRHSMMEVEGFSTEKGEVPLTNPAGITAAINWDSTSNMVYEIAIPKKEFFGADYPEKDIDNTDITLNVEINALPRSASGSDSRGSHGEGDKSGMGSYGRGQFNGGSYGTGNRGMNRQWSETDRVSLNSKASFKQKFTLGKEGE